jgi:hypothetical protein
MFSDNILLLADNMLYANVMLSADNMMLSNYIL